YLFGKPSVAAPSSLSVATFPLSYNRLSVCINNVVCSALVDSGSDVTIISESLRQRLHLVATPWRGSSFCGADSLSFSSSPLGVTTFRLSLGDAVFPVSAVVFSKCVADLILGYDFLTEHGVTLNFLFNQMSLPFPDYTQDSVDVNECYAVVKDSSVVEPQCASVITFVINDLPTGDSSFILQPRNIPNKHSCLRSEEHTSELQSRENLVCSLLL